MNAKRRAWLVRFWRETARPILIVLIVLGAFRSAVADWNDVPTGSMKPTILEGDRVFVNKLAYDLKVPFTRWHLFEWDRPRRGDVVIFFSPADGKRMVKRVVGLPGDRVKLTDNRLLINGAKAQYQPADPSVIGQIDAASQPQHRIASEQLDGRWHPVMTTPRLRAQRSFPAVTIPEGHFFMMGDNRDNSADSRSFGFVPREQILGRATAVAFSLDRNNYYKPRWDRFFTALP